jgi:dTDP-D-glucose 4,6-dehydratase
MLVLAGKAKRMPLTGIALVTGGAGFIGSHIAAALMAEGARVRVLDDLSTGHRENLEEIGGDLDFIEGSVADEQLLNKALDGVEVVFHEAAIPSVPRSVEAPRKRISHLSTVRFPFARRRAKRGAARGLRCFEFGVRRPADAAES